MREFERSGDLDLDGEEETARRPVLDLDERREGVAPALVAAAEFEPSRGMLERQNRKKTYRSPVLFPEILGYSKKGTTTTNIAEFTVE